MASVESQVFMKSTSHLEKNQICSNGFRVSTLNISDVDEIVGWYKGWFHFSCDTFSVIICKSFKRSLRRFLVSDRRCIR